MTAHYCHIRHNLFTNSSFYFLQLVGPNKVPPPPLQLTAKELRTIPNREGSRRDAELNQVMSVNEADIPSESVQAFHHPGQMERSSFIAGRMVDPLVPIISEANSNNTNSLQPTADNLCYNDEDARFERPLSLFGRVKRFFGMDPEPEISWRQNPIQEEVEDMAAPSSFWNKKRNNL